MVFHCLLLLSGLVSFYSYSPSCIWVRSCVDNYYYGFLLFFSCFYCTDTLTVLFYFVHICSLLYGVSCSSEFGLEFYRLQVTFTMHDLSILHVVAQRPKYRRKLCGFIVLVLKA